MVTRIDTPSNMIFGRPLFNELSVVLSLCYLLMKFKTDKGIASVRGKKIETRRGCMLVARVIMEQLEVMILETTKE